MVKTVKSYTSSASDIVTIVGIVFGAIWAWNNFATELAHGNILSMRVDLSQVRIDAAHTLLKADTILKNIGKVQVAAAVSAKENRHGQGCVITVIQYDSLPTPEEVGAPENMGVIDWDVAESAKCRFIVHYNLLCGYTAYKNSAYTINPGVEFHEPIEIVVTPGRLYAVRVRFFGDNGWTNADLQYISILADNNATGAVKTP